MKIPSRPIKFVLIFLVSLELAFRAGDWVKQRLDYGADAIWNFVPGVYRIMCLGDSTTEEGGEGAYPSQLQRYLNRYTKGALRFQVINHGIAGAESGEIVNKAIEWVRNEHPNMVVVMMGFNNFDKLENAQYEMSPDFQDPLMNIVGRSKLFHLADIFVRRLKADLRSYMSGPPKKDESGAGKDHSVPRQDYLTFLYGMQLNQQGRYAQAESVLNVLSAKQGMDERFVYMVQQALQISYVELKEYDKIKSTHADLTDIAPYMMADSFFENLCISDRKSAMDMLSYEVSANPQNLVWNALMSYCYDVESMADYFKPEEFGGSLNGIAPLLERLGQSPSGFHDIREAVDWLNTTVVPYQIYARYRTSHGEDESIFRIQPEEFLWTDAHYLDVVGTPHGREMKRAILRLLYPREMPQGHEYDYIDKAYVYYVKARNLREGSLKKDYLALYQLLSDYNVKKVFVGYPNRDIGPLKAMFYPSEHYPDILFVENVGNFEASLDRQQRHLYFKDQETKSEMGHATDYGNYLLASNIGQQILVYLGKRN